MTIDQAEATMHLEVCRAIGFCPLYTLVGSKVFYWLTTKNSLKNHRPPVNVQVVHHMQGLLAACSPYEATAAKPSEAPSGPLLAVQGPYCRWGRIGFGTVDPSCLSPRHRVAHPPTVPLHVNPFIPNLPSWVLCPLYTDTCRDPCLRL